jgi:putative flippase GtrA
MKKLTHAELFRFALVGFASFSINFLMLILLHQALGLSLVLAQLLAGETAIIGSFMLHHNWTYSKYARQSLWQRFLKFNASAATGSLIVLAVLLVTVHVFGFYYLVGLVLGAVAAAIWNFVMNRFVIWRSLGLPQPPE